MTKKLIITTDFTSKLSLFKLDRKILNNLKKRHKNIIIKKIDPIWCMDAKTICAPDRIVKIPRKVCIKRKIAIKKAVFFKYLRSLFFKILKAIKINNKIIK